MTLRRNRPYCHTPRRTSLLSTRFFGLSIIQNPEFESSIDADEKLNALEPHPLYRARRRQHDDSLTPLEKSSYTSLNASINSIGTTASIVCAYYASYLQQCTPENCVNLLTTQSSILRKLKLLGTTTVYPPPPSGTDLKISVVMFADAGRLHDYGQLSYIGGILIGTLARGSTFYTLTWSSHKS